MQGSCRLYPTIITDGRLGQCRSITKACHMVRFLPRNRLGSWFTLQSQHLFPDLLLVLKLLMGEELQHHSPRQPKPGVGLIVNQRTGMQDPWAYEDQLLHKRSIITKKKVGKTALGGQKCCTRPNGSAPSTLPTHLHLHQLVYKILPNILSIC